MVWLLAEDYQRERYVFSIDSSSELDLLPRYKVRGQDILHTVSSCCPGSKAICTDGTVYALNGKKNQWVKVTQASSGGTGGSDTGSVLPDDLEYATNADIDKMF